MCEENNIELMLDTRAVAPIVETAREPSKEQKHSSLQLLPESEPAGTISSRATGVIVEYYSGRGAILAKQIIDASANGLLPWWIAGNEGCDVNPPKRRGLVQSYLWIGGVDIPKFLDWVFQQPPGLFEMYPNNEAQLQKHAETGRLFWLKSKNFGEPEKVFDEAEDQEDLDVLFKGNFAVGGFYLKWAGNYPRHGVFALDGPYYREDSLNGKTWTSMHTRNLYGCWGLFRIIRHFPGWQNAYIHRTCERMGLRTTRVPKGIYRINGDDLKEHREKPDVIGVGDWHDRSAEEDKGIWGYHIPLRALIPNQIDGLTFCARAISFLPPAMNAHRGIGTTIVCGQGAGIGTAIALAHNTEPRYVDLESLSQLLHSQDVITNIPKIK